MNRLTTITAAFLLAGCSGPTSPDVPAFPSGKMLVIEQTSGKTYLVNLADSARTPVSEFAGPIAASSSSILTPSAEAVVGFWREGVSKLVRVTSVLDGSVRQIAALPDPIIGGVVALTPDGSKLTLGLVNYEGSEQTEFHELDVATGAITPLLSTPTGASLNDIQWLPDGQRLLATVYLPEQDLTEVRLFSRATPIATGTIVAAIGCWRIHSLIVAPSGRQLIFQCTRVDAAAPTGFTVTFESIGLDGARPAVIPADFQSSGQVRFSPDGGFLAYTNIDDQRVWFLRLGTGERWKAFDSDARAEVADWR